MKNTIVIVGVILILFVLVGSVVLQLSGTMQSAQVSQRMVWQAPVVGGEIETLEVTDFSGDGEDEILAQTPAQLAVVSAQGKMLLSQDFFNAKTTLGDLDSNGLEEFVVAEPQGGTLWVAAYTGDGTNLWETLVPDVGAPSRGLTLDFEDDREREVVFGTDSGVLVCLEGRTGELRLSFGSQRQSPCARERRCMARRASLSGSGCVRRPRSPSGRGRCARLGKRFSPTGAPLEGL
jgi:outer membrane protein assembly factor BamB